jgi:hypothetical protein
MNNPPEMPEAPLIWTGIDEGNRVGFLGVVGVEEDAIIALVGVCNRVPLEFRASTPP